MSSRTRKRKQTQQQQRRSDLGDGIHFIIHAPGDWPVGDCLEQISAHAAAIDVISNGSAADVGDKARVWLGDNPTEGRMKAAARGNEPYLIFMDADSVLEDPAMLNIVIAHLSTDAVVVGPLLTDAMGLTFGAGYAFSSNGRPYYRFKGWKADHRKVAAARDDLQAVPFNFLATTREAWRKLGGLRDYWGGFPFAEADYCTRASGFGRVVYEPAIRVQTTGQLVPTQGIDGGVQMLLSSAHPSYDEWALL